MVETDKASSHECPVCFTLIKRRASVGRRILCPSCESYFVVTPSSLSSPTAKAPTGPSPAEAGKDIEEIEKSQKGGTTPELEETDFGDIDDTEDSGDEESELADWDMDMENEEDSRLESAEKSDGIEPKSPGKEASDVADTEDEDGPQKSLVLSARDLGSEVLRPYRKATLPQLVREPLTRARVAGLLLIVVFFLGLATSFTYALTGATDVDPFDTTNSVNLQVIVQNDTAYEIEEALVELPERQLAVLTNERGKAILPNLPEGEHTLKVSKPGFNNVTLQLTLRSIMVPLITVNLTEGGWDRAEDRREQTDLPDAGFYYLLSTLFLICSIAAFAAGSFALSRRNYRMALGGAVLGLLSYGFIYGSLLSLLALLLLIFAPREFQAEDDRENEK